MVEARAKTGTHDEHTDSARTAWYVTHRSRYQDLVPPFFWLADTAWALHQNLSRDDFARYLDDAAAAGLNVIQP
jgi:hypothetical protein